MKLFVPQKAWLELLLEQRRMGYLSRRAFLRRAGEMGLAGGLADMLLESCEKRQQPASNNAQCKITWLSESDNYGSYDYLAQKFNQFYRDIQVSVSKGPDSSTQSHDELVTILRAKKSSPVVLSPDVIWMSEFVNNGWIIPLDDLWQQMKQNDYLEKPRQAVTFRDQKNNGRQQIWAAPLHTDIGLQYYRTDFRGIFAGPAQTWDELENRAHQLQKEGRVKWGYVWQGAAYEGLVCNLVEVLSSYKATIFAPQNPQEVTINSPEAMQAVTRMRSWVGTISPPDTTIYQELNCVDQWRQGNAAFMRCWPSSSALSKDYSQSKVAQSFGFAPLPSGAGSCLGGWQLAINSYASTEDQQAASQFIRWMLQEEAQQYMAVKEGFPVTLKSLYQDSYVQDWNPVFAYLNQSSSSPSKGSLLDSLLHNAQLRPISPYYPQIASAVANHINRALAGLETPEQALQSLQIELESIVADNQQQPRYVCILDH